MHAEAAAETTVPELLQALHNSNPRTRWSAAHELGELRDARAVPELIQALRDEHKMVRMYAAAALGAIQDARAAQALLQAFADPEWCVRDQAAWALRQIADPNDAAPLAVRLKNPKTDVASVAWVLGGFDTPVAVAALAALLKEPEAGARLRAVQALSQLKSDETFEPLCVALEDREADVRRCAVRALIGLDKAKAQPVLKARLAQEKSEELRRIMADFLHAMSPAAKLVAHWSFDDRNARVARDVTGRGHDGEVRGAQPVAGRSGAALRFGPDQFVSLGQLPELPIANRPFTVMAWVKTDARDGVVVARGGAACGFSLYLKDGLPKFGIHRVQDGPGWIAAGTKPVGRGWAHLAGVVRQNEIQLFVNGQLAARTKTPGFIPGNCGQGMEIGCDLGNSPAEITTPFQGVIDEVKMYHAALATGDIAEAIQPGDKTATANR